MHEELAMIYRDRHDAGRYLAAKLRKYADRLDVLVLALPRGGVPVAYEVARALHVPLDIFLVRKLGLPGHEELAMGALASGGVRVLNEHVVHGLNVSEDTIARVTIAEQEELTRRERLYRGDRPAPEVRDQTIILIDDGLATGSTMRAAVAALRRHEPARIVVAVPVGAVETCAEFQDEADETICARTPDPFYAVGAWYADFSQTTDEEVRLLLRLADENHSTRQRDPIDSPRVPEHYSDGKHDAENLQCPDQSANPICDESCALHIQREEAQAARSIIANDETP
jgi:putative phosphoribosyl transferase